MWNYTIDIDLSFYIYNLFLCENGDKREIEYLVCQVSFLLCWGRQFHAFCVWAGGSRSLVMDLSGSQKKTFS